MIPQKVMEVVQVDYVTCVPVDETNYTAANSAQRRIVAAKQTTLFEAEDKDNGGDSKGNTKKN